MTRTQAETSGTSSTGAVAVPGVGRRLLFSAGRLVLIACVVWCGWSTATTLSEVCSGPRSPQALASEQAPTGERSPVEWLSALQEGEWRFAGTPLQLRFSGLSAAEVVRQIELRPRHALEGRKLSALGRQALALMKALKVPRRRIDGGGVYALDRPDLKVRLFTRGDGAGEEMHSGRLALLSERGWLLLETGSEREQMAEADASVGSLLSLPAGAQRLCDRSDARGRRVVEVVSVEGDWSSLCRAWRSEGWAVEVFLDSDRGIVGACRQGGRTIQVLARAAVGSSRRLFVVLMEAPA